MTLLGWDIGGSSTKVCRVEDGVVAVALSRPFEVKDAPDALPDLLRRLAAEAASGAGVEAHAVTMTAELSRNFLTKRDGVRHVIAAVRSAFPAPVPIHVFTTRGAFVGPDRACIDSRDVASANWMATASVVAGTVSDALLIDVGSTTTDLVPIAGGAVVSAGLTDPDRLASGELVYTGVFRSPVEGIAHEVVIGARTYGVAAEAFATSGDVYVWLGDVAADAYEWPTADGRPPDRGFAGERLRRALCADADSMSPSDVQTLAQALADAQVARIARAIRRVRERHPSIARAVVVGVGAFVGERAARAAGLEIEAGADGRHLMESRCAPAAAVALLLGRALGEVPGNVERGPSSPMSVFPTRAFERVVKVGGGLAAHPDALRAVLDDLMNAGSPLVVPGGGPLADTVRVLDRALALGDSHAHWMAVLAMDQYAELLVSQCRRAVRVETLEEARHVAMSKRLPVLAPSRWLRQADPLPHSWDVTSDSIAAWVAGQAGASSLVLVKPPRATGRLTDPYFEQALPAGVVCDIVAADEWTRLRTALGIAS